MINTKCPECSTRFYVSEELIGKRVVRFRCRKCSGIITVDGSRVGESKSSSSTKPRNAGLRSQRSAGEDWPPEESVLRRSLMLGATQDPTGSPSSPSDNPLARPSDQQHQQPQKGRSKLATIGTFPQAATPGQATPKRKHDERAAEPKLQEADDATQPTTIWKKKNGDDATGPWKVAEGRHPVAAKTTGERPAPGKPDAPKPDAPKLDASQPDAAQPGLIKPIAIKTILGPNGLPSEPPKRAKDGTHKSGDSADKPKADVAKSGKNDAAKKDQAGASRSKEKPGETSGSKPRLSKISMEVGSFFQLPSGDDDVDVQVEFDEAPAQEEEPELDLLSIYPPDHNPRGSVRPPERPIEPVSEKKKSSRPPNRGQTTNLRSKPPAPKQAVNGVQPARIDFGADIGSKRPKPKDDTVDLYNTFTSPTGTSAQRKPSTGTFTSPILAPTPVNAHAAKSEQSSGTTRLIAIGAAAAVLIGAAVAVIVVVLGRDPQAVAANATHGDTAVHVAAGHPEQPSHPAQPETHVAVATPPEPANPTDPPEAAAKKDPADSAPTATAVPAVPAAEPKIASGSAGTSSPPKTVGATTGQPAAGGDKPPPAATTAPTAAKTAAATPGGAATPATAAKQAAPAGGGGEFSASAARAKVRGVLGSATQSCKQPDGPTGSGNISVTWDPSGRVIVASVDNSARWKGVGGCISGAVRGGARLPAFSGGPQSISVSFSVQ